MKEDQIISVLVGLAGAVGNNGKTAHTDQIVIDALAFCHHNPTAGEEAYQAVACLIQKEKYAISPNCATCPSPCGNTSDYDMRRFYGANDITQKAKREMLAEMKKLASRLKKERAIQAPECLYKAISYFGYDLDAKQYEELAKELAQMGLLQQGGFQ